MSELTEGDRYLLEQIRTGAAEGWSQFVDRYQGRLEAFAREQLHHAADAEDAVQETFLSFLKGLDSFRGQASLETYLFSILRRKIVDTLRGRALHVCLLSDALRSGGGDDPMRTDANMEARHPAASWYAVRHETEDRLRQVLSQALRDLVSHMKESLNFQHLQAVELIFYAQIRNKDVAATLSIEQTQVALLKHRFLKRMSQQAAESGEATFEESIRDDVFAHDALITQLWEQLRPSCPKRSTIGAYLLKTLDAPWHDYVGFHLDRLGCRLCRANFDDLNRQTDEAQTAVLRDRIMQSTVGFLRT